MKCAPGGAGGAAAAPGSSSAPPPGAALPDRAARQHAIAMADALLALVQALASSTSGCTALADAGVVSSLMPLLRDTHPDHVGLVVAAVRILEALVDFSQSALTLFRWRGGGPPGGLGLGRASNGARLACLERRGRCLLGARLSHAPAPRAPPRLQIPAPGTSAACRSSLRAWGWRSASRRHRRRAARPPPPRAVGTRRWRPRRRRHSRRRATPRAPRPQRPAARGSP
jgi:hypothetical protein